MHNKISILFTGDFYAGGRIEQLIEQEKYDTVFNEMYDEIQNNDIAITNLECPLTRANNPIKKTGPPLKSNPETIYALKHAGFNLLALANNHIMDYGRQGLKDTLTLCKSNGMDYLGAGLNAKDAGQIFYKKIKNKKLAFINITENEWSTTYDEQPGASPLDPVANYYAIQQAKSMADFVFVIVHGGHEMYPFPSPRMKKTYRFFVDAGADAVIGHHTHCFSGYELYQNKPIFYSLGNFIFDRPDIKNPMWNTGFAVKILIENSNINFKVIPYKQNNEIPGIHLMNHKEKQEFKKEIKQMQHIIADDALLKNEFRQYISNVTKQYKAYLEPHANKYLYALQNRGLFPGLLSKRKKRLLLNLIRCESHKDIVLKILNDENRHP